MEGLFAPLYASISTAAAQVAPGFQSSGADASHTGWPEAMFISAAIIGGCALVAVIVWQVFLTARKSIESKADEEAAQELQRVTQRAVASNEQAATELAKISQSVADLNARMGAIEKLLREVEKPPAAGPTPCRPHSLVVSPQEGCYAGNSRG